MKYYLLLFIFCLSTISDGQNSSKLVIQDTRGINDLPSFNTYSIRADFKTRASIGVPGAGTFSGNITISPWSDASGGLNHQLNFNDGGIYYRNGSYDSKSWNGWQRIIKEEVGNIVKLNNFNLTFNSRLSANLWDNFTYQNNTVGHYALQWSSDTWNPAEATLYLTSYGGMRLFTNGIAKVNIHKSGNIGIGIDYPRNKLDVAGIIRATEVKVEAQPWADFVFDKDYKLPTLDEVKAHIDEHRHLPNIPSEKDIQENGIGLGEMQAKLLQKIEELTLYVIQQNQKIDDQSIQLKEQKLHIKEQNSRIKKLENKQ